MKTADRICAVALILASLFMIQATSQLEELAYQVLSNKLFPYVTFAFVILLSLGLLVSTFVTPELVLPADYWRRIVSRRRLIMLGLFCVYLVVMPWIGFLTTSAIFMLATVAALSPNLRKDLPIAVTLTAGIIGLIYLVFVHWLQVFLP